MPVISIRLTDNELNQIKKEAENRGIGVSNYIKNVLFAENNRPNFLTNEIIIHNIEKKAEQGELNAPFTLAEAFDDEEYIKYYNFIPAGKAFFKFATTKGTRAYNLLEALGGKPAKYVFRK